MNESGKRFLTTIWRATQTTWLIVGITLIMLVIVESCFRVKGALSEKSATKPNPAAQARDPRTTEPWSADFTREYDATRPQRWKSYVYFGRLPNFRGRYINIDSLGHRVTPQPRTGTTFAKVFFFGGSTMWGNDNRDDHTIAAEAARRLQPLAPSGSHIEVTNFGESGYVFTQGLLQLMLELRAGNRPDVVVFYDGINDVGTTVQYGVAGIPQNESKRVSEFAMGRVLDRTGFERGWRKDVKAWRLLASQAFEQLATVAWVRSKKAPPPQQFIAADSAARSTVRIYAENARIIEALGRAYGFVPIFVWQPALHSTQKVLTPFEAGIMKGIDGNDFQRRLKETHRLIPALVDSVMASVAPGRFIDEAALFTGDTMAVFVDRIGHTTEASVPGILDGFWPAVQAAVLHQRAQSVRISPLRH